jgi:hypothetical protein
MGGQ